MFAFLEHRSVLFWTIVGMIFVSLLGIVDYLTGYELSFSLFYLAPIAAVAWCATRKLGLIISVYSALTWLLAELAAGQTYSQPVIYFWNTLIRFGFFVVVTYLISALREAHEVQRTLARTDPISGAVNARYFNELIEMEIARSRRSLSPFTIAYLDLDNFKAVNDLWGHAHGNEVIRFIASEMRARLRSMDTVARMGGDEFALLLPGAGQPEAQSIIPRLHTDLTDQMQTRNWLVTFSVGVVICGAIPDSANELVNMADELMYIVKNSTKNDVRFSVYTGRYEPESQSPE